MVLGIGVRRSALPTPIGSLTLLPFDWYLRMLSPEKAGDTARSYKPRNRWLCDQARNVNSQAGEDGILEAALKLLPSRNRWCIEFGAWDGKYLSNTFNLVEQQQYQVVLIEGDLEKYHRLCHTYPHKDRAIFIHAFVGWSGECCLDQILTGHSLPTDPDVLSVDVDGNDFHIWQATETIRPKLVLIEYNPTMPNCLDFVQPRDANCNQGSSPAALVKLAKDKGYELIAATDINLLFVDRVYYDLFQIECNSLEEIRVEQPTYLFFGYDGTVFVHGPSRLLWHEINLTADQVQVLPRSLRRYPPTYSSLQRFAWRVFFMFTEPKEGLRRLKRYAQRSLQ
jgi:hypothetical protein